MPTSTRTGSPNGQGNRSQNRQGQSQQSEPQQPVPPRPPATIRAIIANTTSGPQQPGQPQPEPEQLRPTAEIEAYKEPSPPVRTQALPAPLDKDAETEPIINESTAATTNIFFSVNSSGKAMNSRKLLLSLNKSTKATSQNGKTKINVKTNREFLTKKHISYSKRKTIANKKKTLRN